MAPLAGAENPGPNVRALTMEVAPGFRLSDGGVDGS